MYQEDGRSEGSNIQWKKFMPLLTKINKPEKLNPSTLGKLWYEEEARKDPGRFKGSTWESEGDALRQFYIGMAQSILDCLVDSGIVS